MNKPIVFISHITEEREIALEFKELIESSFLGMLEVFVSSDETSISAGARWLDNITDSLKNCSIELILCSPKSVERPWINFEAGAGWIRDIPVIPLCHSGMEPSNLPIPLNLLQAAKISEVSSLKLIFPVLAQAIGAKIPNADFTNFIDKVKKFEEKYTFWDECNLHFGYLNEFNSHIIPTLKENRGVRMELRETDIAVMEKWMKEFFSKESMLYFRRTGEISVSSNGMHHSCQITTGERFDQIKNNPNFKY